VTVTPDQLHYRMPAEWEPHTATWLSWPHNRDTWPGTFAPIPEVWTELVRTLAAYEPVRILAGGEGVMSEARRYVGNIPGVELYDIPTNDAWMRDHGPTFLVNATGAPPALVDWQYNAWGGKYPPFDQDDLVGKRIAKKTGYQRFAPGVVLEGGAIDVNGRGTVLTTASCLLNENRNPGMSKPAMEQILRDNLGVKHVIWLSGGIAGDDTDGHIDQLARFVAPGVVLAMTEDDPSDANHDPLAENVSQLREATDQDGNPLEIVTLPMPRAIYHDEYRLPASYANFYIANGVVIVPTFDDPHDETALRTLGELFPSRRVCGLPAIDLIWGLGAYHCVTQQQPKANLGPAVSPD